MKETQVVSFERGEFMERYQCLYVPLASAAKSVYLHCDVDCEFPKIMYHPTVVDTHSANRIMNIPHSHT